MGKSAAPGPRTRARELALQALYQAQMTGHDAAELKRQFRDRQGYDLADQEYFETLLTAVCNRLDELRSLLAAYADRPVEQLDPVEFAVLAIGYHELERCPEIPYRAVINEAVNLARRFGAEDGHKYVNAILDRAAGRLRAAEAS